MAKQEFNGNSKFSLEVIRNKENRGFCAANNQGIRMGGDLIALLNNDAEAAPGWLEALASAIRMGDDIGMVASKIRVKNHPRRVAEVVHLMYPQFHKRGHGS